jgi:nucleotidyltransferase/DNA polymerase involved in DNA repair
MSDSTIACLLVTHLPVKAERQRYPALRGKPLVIVESSGSGDLALASSPEAQGVREGMTLPEVLACCPGATLLPADHRFYDNVFDRMADNIAMRCPVVERAELGCVYAGLEGMSPLYGGEARLIASLLQSVPPDFGLRVGVASGKFAAYVSAATAPPGRAVKTQLDSAAFLNSHSIDPLISPQARARLRRSGIAAIKQLAA